MITLTPTAARIVLDSARQSGDSENLALRFAGTKNADGSIHYGMGFDEERDGDTRFTSEGVTLVVSASSIDLLDGMTVDFVELEPGKPQFIFINPKDANYSRTQ
jgi:iron-sulfur cluster assembly protein